MLQWSGIQVCIHLNFYFYADLICRILSPIWEFLISALNVISQKKIALFLLQGITLMDSRQTLGEFCPRKWWLWFVIPFLKSRRMQRGGTANGALVPTLQLDGDQPWIFSEAPKRRRQGNPVVSWHLCHDFKDCLSLSASCSLA